MRYLIKCLFASLLLTISISAYSQDSTSVSTRPKIGLVLSGGGAKGAAHVGVIKRIEELAQPWTGAEEKSGIVSVDSNRWF